MRVLGPRWLVRLLCPAMLLAALMPACGGSPHDVPFRLGTVDRNLTYCNPQELDLYIPRSSVTRPLPLAIYVPTGEA